MNWPDFTKRSNAIVILLALEVMFFVAMFVAFMLPHAPDKLRDACLAAFTGATGMLALGLKLGGPETPTVDDDKGGTVQQTTTVTPPEKSQQ